MKDSLCGHRNTAAVWAKVLNSAGSGASTPALSPPFAVTTAFTSAPGDPRQPVYTGKGGWVVTCLKAHRSQVRRESVHDADDSRLSVITAAHDTCKCASGVHGVHHRLDAGIVLPSYEWITLKEVGEGKRVENGIQRHGSILFVEGAFYSEVEGEKFTPWSTFPTNSQR